MYKVSTFLSESDHGYSAVPLFGPADSVFEKTASATLLPEVLAYIKDLKPRAGSQYVLVNAMGAGEYYGCFPAGTLVEVAGGEVPVERVEPGALVRTHKNRYRRVVARTPRQAEELCDLYAQGLPSNLPALTATPNHELWAVSRDEFLRSKRENIFFADTTRPVEERRREAMEDLRFDWIPIASMRPGDYITEPFPLDEDPGALGDERWNRPEVAFLMGLYAAEGCIARRYDRDDARPASVIYVVSGEETSVIEEARKHTEALGHGLQDYKSESGTSYRLQLCFAEFARLCEEHIGTPALDKKLSPAILRMPRAWQKTFFAAYAAGDGCVRTSVKEEATIRCVSASAALLRGMRLLVARAGLVGSISGRHNKKATWYAGNPVYELSISGGQLKGRGTPKSYLHPDGFILSAVKRVEQYDWEGEVYDLTVEEDSSFVASGICVHNSNINGDWFEESGLVHTPTNWSGNPLLDKELGKGWTYGYPTFYNALPYAHHRNKDPSRAYGEVELAVWNELMKRVELVCRVDYDKCQQFGGASVWDKLKVGQFPDVSMGSKVCYDLSSITTDWDLYNKALATFNPTQYAYPGLAVVEYHKKLKEKDGVGIRGLSITRADYDEWTTNHMNRILPDGRKVFVYNPYPRFFDISFVFIGADRTAKVMVFIVRHGMPRYVPSAEAGEKISSILDANGEPFVKAASADELYHGSAEKRDVLEPHQAEGQNSFQNQDAVYASTDPLEAMLYAVGSTLKGETDYTVTPKDRLVIVGDAEPKAGFLHTLPSDGAVYGKGKANEGQAYIKDDVEPVSVKKVTPAKVEEHIVHVDTKAEMKKELLKDTKEAMADLLLKAAFGFKGAELKQGEIEKELPADKAVPLLSKTDKDIPEWAINALSSVPEDKALGTTGAMGIVL
ncbi:MAG: LAGLIDADG family homing endonuclease, partial [Candidatus Neomarinimicrobiota bacterium]